MKLLPDADLLIITPLLLVALLVLSIIAYRQKRTTAFLLFMLACISYILLQFSPFLIGSFFLARGVKSSGSLIASYPKLAFDINRVIRPVFVGLLVASMICFIRERREITTPEA